MRRDDRSVEEIILDWIGNRIHKIGRRSRDLQNKEPNKPVKLGDPPRSSELYDLGIIRAWLKSQESEIYDELEGEV